MSRRSRILATVEKCTYPCRVSRSLLPSRYRLGTWRPGLCQSWERAQPGSARLQYELAKETRHLYKVCWLTVNKKQTKLQSRPTSDLFAWFCQLARLSGTALNSLGGAHSSQPNAYAIKKIICPNLATGSDTPNLSSSNGSPFAYTEAL